MTIEQAAYVLSHKGKYWSHQISEAQRISEEFLKKVGTSTCMDIMAYRAVYNDWLGLEHDDAIDNRRTDD